MWKPKLGWSRGPIWLFCDGATGAVLGQEAADGSDDRGRGEAHLRKTHPCTAAAVARGIDGQILDWAWQRLPRVTNNEAEYAGLLLGLALATRLHAQESICVLDSEIVVGQMAGRFAVKSSRLRHWHAQATTAARGLPNVRYIQAPRSWNRLADGLAAQAAIPWSSLVVALAERAGEKMMG